MTRHQKRKIDETHVEVCCRLLLLIAHLLFSLKCYVKIYYLNVSLGIQPVRWWVSGLISPAGAGLFWEKNTIDWLINLGWNQQTNMLIISIRVQCKKIFLAHLSSIVLVARTWGAWCSQLAGTWRIHKGEKYREDRTWEIWDRYMVFLSFSTRVQWLPEAVFLWIFPQLHLSMFLLSRFWMNRLGSCLVFCIHSDTIQKIIMPWSTIVQNEDSAWTTPSRLENAWFSVVVWMTYLFLSSIAQAF